MPLFRLDGKLIYFAHIPKTGGTSIERYIQSNYSTALLQNRSYEWSVCLAQHVHHQIADNLVPTHFYDFGFVVVRDPVARLVSEYRMRVELNDRLPLNISKPPFRRVEHRLRRIRPFPNFDSWVRQVLSRYRGNTYVYANHIRPQVEFINPAHKIFKFEDGLHHVFDWLDALVGSKIHERSHERRGDQEIPVEISGRTEALIREFYSKDFELMSSL